MLRPQPLGTRSGSRDLCSPCVKWGEPPALSGLFKMGWGAKPL